MRGYGWFGLGKTSFPQTSKLFSPTYTGVFSVQDIFSPGISSQDIFPPRPLNLTISTISEVLKKHRKNAENAKKMSQSWVKISVEEWETIQVQCQISNFSKNWTHLSIQSYSQYLSLFSHPNQPYNYLKTTTKGLKVQDIEHNSQHTIKYQPR